MASLSETLGSLHEPISYRLAHLPRTGYEVEDKILCHCTLNYIYNAYKIRYEIYNDLDQLVIRGTYKGEPSPVIFEVQPHRIYFTHFWVTQNMLSGIDKHPFFGVPDNNDVPPKKPKETFEQSYFGFLITDKAIRKLRQRQQKQKQPLPSESLEKRIARLR